MWILRLLPLPSPPPPARPRRRCRARARRPVPGPRRPPARQAGADLGHAPPRASTWRRLRGPEAGRDGGPRRALDRRPGALGREPPRAPTSSSPGRRPSRSTTSLVGEVWLCAGQARHGVHGRLAALGTGRRRRGGRGPQPAHPPVQGRAQAAATPHRDGPDGDWTPCSPGRRWPASPRWAIFSRGTSPPRLGVPIGIIDCSQAGTPIEAWMSPAALGALPGHPGRASRRGAGARAGDLAAGLGSSTGDRPALRPTRSAASSGTRARPTSGAPRTMPRSSRR